MFFNSKFAILHKSMEDTPETRVSKIEEHKKDLQENWTFVKSGNVLDADMLVKYFGDTYKCVEAEGANSFQKVLLGMNLLIELTPPKTLVEEGYMLRADFPETFNQWDGALFREMVTKSTCLDVLHSLYVFYINRKELTVTAY